MRKLLLTLGCVVSLALPAVYFFSCSVPTDEKPEPPIVDPDPDVKPPEPPEPPEPVAYYSNSITWRSYDDDKDQWIMASTVSKDKENFERWSKMIPIAKGKDKDSIIDGTSIANETPEQRKAKAEFLWEVLKNNETMVNGSIDKEALKRAIKENILIAYAQENDERPFNIYQIRIKFVNNEKKVHKNTVFDIKNKKDIKILTITLKPY